jgi:quercetin dioxygenase-like cupin family protein
VEVMVGWEDGGMADAVSPVDLASLAAGGGDPGALWRLDGEDLQANLVRLGRGDRIAPHRNDEVEVLVVVVSPALWVSTWRMAAASRSTPRCCW